MQSTSAFEGYLLDIASEMLACFPEKLKDNDIKLQDYVKNANDSIVMMVEQQTDSLGFKRFEAISETVMKYFQPKPFKSTALPVVQEFKATRDLFGLSAQASNAVSSWSLLIFPALFAAGMTLVDTTDGVLMLGAYEWAYRNPMRKLFYNLTITSVSVLVALVVGGIETLGLIPNQFHLQGVFWNVISDLNDNFGVLGYGIVALFVVSWGVSFLVYRFKRYDRHAKQG